MLVGAFRFADPLVWALFGLLIGSAALIYGLSRANNYRIGKYLSVPIAAVGVAALLLTARIDADNYKVRQGTLRDIPSEKLPAVFTHSDSGTITLLVGAQKCELTLPVRLVLGLDPDGWKLRYRPVMDWSDSNGHYGLGYHEIASLGQICDTRPPQD